MVNMPNLPALSLEELRVEIKKEYRAVARDPRQGFHFHTGRDATDRLGYAPDLYANVPEGNLASFAGMGNPFLAGPIHAGETVIDVGSGAGLDSLIAGRLVGIDMTPEMLEKARAGAQAMGAAHVEFREGLAEELPLPDGYADVVISNGVLNLTLDKATTLREWARVLKPGGRLQIGDIVLARSVPQSAMKDISLWTGWIAGGLLEADLIRAVRAAGFEDVEIVDKFDIFEGVPNPSDALQFGTQGISLRARKP